MGSGDYYWGLYRDYYRDRFPHGPAKNQTVEANIGFRVEVLFIS